MAGKRWVYIGEGYGPICPECGSAHTYAYKKREYPTHAWQYRICRNCEKRYRVPGVLAPGEKPAPPETKESIRARVGDGPFPNGI